MRNGFPFIHKLFEFLRIHFRIGEPFLTFLRPMAPRVLALRASTSSFIYTQLHSSDIAHADFDS